MLLNCSDHITQACANLWRQTLCIDDLKRFGKQRESALNTLNPGWPFGPRGSRDYHY